LGTSQPSNHTFFKILNLKTSIFSIGYEVRFAKKSVLLWNCLPNFKRSATLIHVPFFQEGDAMKKLVTQAPKTGGPNSDKGKLVSSKNALKSGLTTKQLLNQHELERFNQLIKDLSTYYNSPNPLVPLQIERIARIHIQLERIQNGIDILYRKSEQESPVRDKKENFSAANLILLQLKLKLMLKAIDSSLLEKIDNELFSKGLVRLFEHRKSKTSAKEWDGNPQVITQDTLLGAYLYSEADFYQQNMDEYLKDKIEAISHREYDRGLYKDINLEILGDAIDRKALTNHTESIETKNYYEFYQFDSWFNGELSKVPAYIEELRDSLDLDKEKFNTALPNFDDLDRLMRYQTTLSRQLSTAIGELMVLAK
jgi:hypothetical protein